MERCFENPPEDIDELAQAVCDRDTETVDQGYKSFPSGHATSNVIILLIFIRKHVWVID